MIIFQFFLPKIVREAFIVTRNRTTKNSFFLICVNRNLQIEHEISSKTKISKKIINVCSY